MEGLHTNPLQLRSDLQQQSPRSSVSLKATAVAQRSLGVYAVLRVVYQPVRIIVGYIQVVTQIGLVLDLEFPTYIQTVLTALKPLMIDLQSILQLDCLSGGLFNFYTMWIVRVLVIPVLLLGIVLLQYGYERRRVGHSVAVGYAKANVFVVVFLCYPGVCNQVSCRLVQCHESFVETD